MSESLYIGFIFQTGTTSSSQWGCISGGTWPRERLQFMMIVLQFSIRPCSNFFNQGLVEKRTSNPAQSGSNFNRDHDRV
jgi:hypothetical protein